MIMADPGNSLLIILRHTPYGSSLARAGIDTLLAAGAFEQKVSVLFMGSGVFQLLPGQDGKLLGSRNLFKLLSSLPLYDIETIHVQDRPGLDSGQFPPGAQLLDRAGVRELIARHDHVISF